MTTVSIGTWTTLSQLPEPLMRSCAVIDNNDYIYVLGGQSGTNPDNGIMTTNCYSGQISSGTVASWSTSLAILPHRMAGASAVIDSNNYIYIFGGATDTNGYTNTILYSSVSSGTIGSWNTSSVTLPVLMVALRAVIDTSSSPDSPDYVYILGGYGGGGSYNEPLDTIYSATLNSGTVGTWHTETQHFNLPTFKGSATIDKSKRYIYYLGGKSNGYYNICWSGKIGQGHTLDNFSDTGQNPIPQLTELNSAQYYMDNVLVFGGENNLNVPPYSNVSSNLYINPTLNGLITGTSGNWQQTHTLPTPLYGMQSVIDSNGYLYLIGGNIGGTTVQTVYSARLSASSQPICFNEDTKILCLDETTKKEVYIPIQDLKVGQLVKTYLHGYRKLTDLYANFFINTPTEWEKCMYKMKNTDLIVTGTHSILVDQLTDQQKEKQKFYWGDNEYKIDNKYLLLAIVSEEFEQITDNKMYRIYHIRLDNEGEESRRFGIWANGVLTETIFS